MAKSREDYTHRLPGWISLSKGFETQSRYEASIQVKVVAAHSTTKSQCVLVVG